MLTLWAVAMLAVFLFLILSGYVSPIVTLVLVPVVFGGLAGFGVQLGPMMLKGLQQLAPTGVMLAFAILYFSIMVDAGLFDPLVRLVVKIVHGDPVRIVTGTAILGLIICMDGDGATTYIICASALMPLYRRVGLNPLIFTCLLMLSCGVMHIFPWGGPTAKVSAALGLNPSDVYLPLLPVMLVGAIAIVALGYYFGRLERRRIGVVSTANLHVKAGFDLEDESAVERRALKRPKVFVINLVVTVALLCGLLSGAVPLPILFVVAAGIALQVNYPGLKLQKQRIEAHAPTMTRVAALIFASGVFVGVLDGTGMSASLANSIAGLIPEKAGPFLAPIAGLISIPAIFAMGNEGYYFGVLTLLSKAAGHFGITPVEMARASVLSQAVILLSPTAASTWVLMGLAGVELGEHQRFTVKWAVLLSLIMLAAALILGVVPFRRLIS